MLDEATIKSLEATHGEIAHVRGKGNGWEVVFRKPKRSEYRMFKAHLRDPRFAPDALEGMSRACVVYPSQMEYDALLEKYPAIPEACSDAFGALAGLEIQASGK